MEKLFFYTGAIIYGIISMILILVILKIIWNSCKGSLVWRWIDIKLSEIRYLSSGKPFECTQYCYDVLTNRLQHLKELNKWKFEQEFLEKIIKISVIKKTTSVFE